jgi:hypothetical protein
MLERLLIALAAANLVILFSDVLFNLARALTPSLPLR